MTKTLFTSDTHFYHKNIIEYCKRPYGSVEHMNDSLISNWNSVVDPDDDLWFIGDFSFGTVSETEEVLQRLHGRKHLIAGNHDRYGRCAKLDWNKYFVSKQDYLRLKIDGHKLVLCHFPFHSWERGYINLHGHTHGSYESKWMQHDVGVDVNNYTPLLLEDAVKRAMNKPKQELY